MPKSKQQKREEAMMRNRRGFEYNRQYYLSWQMGGERYKNACATRRETWAKEEAVRQRIRFEKWCKSVGLDTHGNVI
jgi:hypothetical protein